MTVHVDIIISVGVKEWLYFVKTKLEENVILSFRCTGGRVHACQWCGHEWRNSRTALLLDCWFCKHLHMHLYSYLYRLDYDQLSQMKVLKLPVEGKLICWFGEEVFNWGKITRKNHIFSILFSASTVCYSSHIKNYNYSYITKTIVQLFSFYFYGDKE